MRLKQVWQCVLQQPKSVQLIRQLSSERKSRYRSPNLFKILLKISYAESWWEWHPSKCWANKYSGKQIFTKLKSSQIFVNYHNLEDADSIYNKNKNIIYEKCHFVMCLEPHV